MAPNVEKHGKTHLRNVCELISHARGKAQQNNVANALRVRAGKPLSKGPLAPYKRYGGGHSRRSRLVVGNSKKRLTGLSKIEREGERERLSPLTRMRDVDC